MIYFGKFKANLKFFSVYYFLNQIYKDSACTTFELWFHLGGLLSHKLHMGRGFAWVVTIGSCLGSKTAVMTCYKASSVFSEAGSFCY